MKYQTRKQLPKIIAASAVLIAGVIGMGALVISSMEQTTADKFGCFEGEHQKQTVVIVDASTPRWDKVQSRALHTYFQEVYDQLDFNERLSFYTTEGDKISSVVTPRFHFCGQASSQADLDLVGAGEAQSGYLARQKQRLFDKQLKPELDVLFALSAEDGRTQKYESPIMEIIQATLRSARLESGDSFILVSDMIQNSESARFCRKKNDMPSFATFKKRRLYQDRLKPSTLAGVEVETLMLMRAGYGQAAGMQYCYSEEELRGFWRNYFIDNSADSPNFIRIRGGFSE